LRLIATIAQITSAAAAAPISAHAQPGSSLDSDSEEFFAAAAPTAAAGAWPVVVVAVVGAEVVTVCVFTVVVVCGGVVTVSVFVGTVTVVVLGGSVTVLVVAVGVSVVVAAVVAVFDAAVAVVDFAVPSLPFACGSVGVSPPCGAVLPLGPVTGARSTLDPVPAPLMLPARLCAPLEPHPTSMITHRTPVTAGKALARCARLEPIDASNSACMMTS
jgi:hypothetical protein